MDDHRSPHGTAPAGAGPKPGPNPVQGPGPGPGRTGRALLFGVPVLLLWLLDLVPSRPDGSWLPLVSGPLAVAVLLVRRGPGIEVRAAAAALASGALTLGVTLGHVDVSSWGLLESFALLALLTVTARTARLPAAYVLCTLLALAIAVAPIRLGVQSEAETFAFVLTVAVGGALALGGYLRSLDGRRALAVTATQEEERRRIARDLHDFVAHHVTGIVVQAQAARAIRETSPEQLDPLLARIEKAGTETLDSMRRLVHVLRAEPGATTRPADLLTELSALVAAHGDAATLQITSQARATALAPEVETSVHRVVQEALTNVTRHAPGATDVRVHLSTHGGQLLVDVSNGPSAQGRSPDRTPPGGHGGLGLIGLRERVEAVGGTFDAGPRPDGGWRLRAAFPADRA
ncbi:sensor histidine kinase [Streptomyces sp. NPDC059002]|uniref:sensor histidine kinase n=1 Tax=Streptomyces sp. NPDC059002 TaxID=3346690 RepID=UPI0036975886